VKSIGVFCGSSSGKKAVYKEMAVLLGKQLAAKNLELVYGAGNIGLMGVIADAVLEANGRVTGFMPENLVKHEIAHTGIQEMHVVKDMMERKQKLIARADAFIVMPGGFGTLDEATEVITWNQLKLIEKPIGFLNTEGYFDHLKAFIAHAAEEGFIRKDHSHSLIFETAPDRLLASLDTFHAATVNDWVADIRKENI
jgi:hypothetical protein